MENACNDIAPITKMETKKKKKPVIDEEYKEAMRLFGIKEDKDE